ncbi:hypothetical protein HOY82DRAFT_121392 [Tuber indicum]|nr:hypothetical protein HOY82DRAFT_121392 [Tuber indicum]
MLLGSNIPESEFPSLKHSSFLSFHLFPFLSLRNHAVPCLGFYFFLFPLLDLFEPGLCITYQLPELDIRNFVEWGLELWRYLFFVGLAFSGVPIGSWGIIAHLRLRLIEGLLVFCASKWMERS